MTRPLRKGALGREPRLAYAFSLGAVLLATLVRAALNPLLGTRAPWVFYFPAIAVVAWRAGAGPAALALALSVLIGWWLWIPPTHTLTVTDPKDLYVVMAFILSGAITVAFGASNERNLRRLQEESERRVQELAESTAALERHVAERTADLQEANAELEGFTYSVSHDMRAPIRAIVANARLLLDDYGDEMPGDAAERIERMATNGRRLGLLIEDLLTYARLNKQELRKAPVDLARLFCEVVEEQRGDIEVEAVAPETLPAVAEPGLMRMVLENLVGNAVKYRRPEVPLRLDLVETQRDGMRGFAVRDNGIGFEMQYAPKLFQAFERLHRIDDYEGTGIGLANVKRIVERHGGAVWAEGEPGVGATFGFTLPG